jgi:predicted cupin superfamily sugar epimerase
MTNDSTSRSETLIRELNMEPLAGESGFIAYCARSAIEVLHDGKPFKANNSIYYLLNREQPINFLHWLFPDDTHVLCEGGPVDYYVFAPDNSVEHHVVGRDVSQGQRPMLMIPGGSWKALKLNSDVEFALMVTIITPQWTKDPDRIKIGAGQQFIDRYADRAPWATSDFLKELIGPNFQ